MKTIAMSAKKSAVWGTGEKKGMGLIFGSADSRRVCRGRRPPKSGYTRQGKREPIYLHEFASVSLMNA
jgi:hypothetical protein